MDLAVGVTAASNSLTKTAATAWGNAGAVSTSQIPPATATSSSPPPKPSTYRMLGLSNGNTNASYDDIDFAIYKYPGQIQVYENGTFKGTFGAYAPGDKLRVAVVGGVVKYRRNGTVFYTSTQGPRPSALEERECPLHPGRLAATGGPHSDHSVNHCCFAIEHMS